MKLKPFPVLTTERLQLRQLSRSDGQEVLFLRTDDKVNKYVVRPSPKDLTEAQEFVDKITKGTKQQEYAYWAISVKESHKMIGSICLWKFSPDQKIAEIGFDLHPLFQNKGIMSEAMICVLAFGFGELNLEKIEAYTHHQNQHSIKLLTKSNFHLVKNKKDPNNDSNVIFEVTKSDY